MFRKLALFQYADYKDVGPFYTATLNQRATDLFFPFSSSYHTYAHLTFHSHPFFICLPFPTPATVPYQMHHCSPSIPRPCGPLGSFRDPSYHGICSIMYRFSLFGLHFSLKMEATVSSETLAAHISKRLYSVLTVTLAEVHAKRIPYFEKENESRRMRSLCRLFTCPNSPY
jgi:hypothetical protein